MAILIIMTVLRFRLSWAFTHVSAQGDNLVTMHADGVAGNRLRTTIQQIRTFQFAGTVDIDLEVSLPFVRPP
jgi:hypothetical protein